MRAATDVIQMAYVVPDLEVAARHWVRTLGCGPFLVNRHLPVTDLVYRGRPSRLDFSMAIAQAGSVQIELIEQHDDAPSCYRDLVPAGASGFHHVAVIPEDYDAELARYAREGFAVASSGVFGELRFSYVDTSPTIGCMTELVENKPQIHAFFEVIRCAAEEWDGVTNPVRPM